MDLRVLRYFVTVAEELHFTRAAERLYLTQPALTHQIKKLESELGVTLLERSKRHVALTEPGRVLLEGARQLLHDAEVLARDTQLAGGVAPDEVVLGYVEYMNLPMITPAVAALRRQHPGVVIDRQEMHSDRQLDALRARSIDVGFTLGPITDPALRTRPLLTGRWTAVLPADHPAAAGDEITLAAVAAEPVIVFERALNPPLHDWLVGELRSANPDLDIAYQTAQARHGPRFVDEGLGVFIAASYVLEDLPPTTVARPITDLEPITVGVTWRADNRNPRVHDLIALIVEQAD